MSSQQPSVIDLPKVIAVGIVSPAAAALTSRFDIAGTLLGLCLRTPLVMQMYEVLSNVVERAPITRLPSLRLFRPVLRLRTRPRPSLLIAIAASASPLVGALAMFALGLGQDLVLVAAGILGGSLVRLSKLSPYRATVDRLLGLTLLIVAACFTWRALLWL